MVAPRGATDSVNSGGPLGLSRCDGCGIDGYSRAPDIGNQTLRCHSGRGEEEVALAKQDNRHFAAEHMPGSFDNPFEHGPGVGGRLADDPQDLGRRRLPRQRLLRFVEEPRVLDCDDRLIGEGLQEFHVVRGEGARFLARHADHAYAGAVAHQRREQHAAIAAQSRQSLDDRRTRFRLGVDDLLGLACANQREWRKIGDRPRRRERRLAGLRPPRRSWA